MSEEIEAMTSISVRLEDRLEGTSSSNTWRVRVINILEEHDLDSFVTIVIEETTTNVGRINYKKNQSKEKRIIYDSMKENLMSVITPLICECVLTHSQIFMRRRTLLKRGI